MIDPAVLRSMLAAGCSAEQIVAVAEDAARALEEKKIAKRAGNAERQRRWRERNALSHVTGVTNGDAVSPKKETSPTPPKEKTTPSISPVGVAREFADFWSLFPNKVGKRDAEKAFANARSRAPLDAILDGLRRYAAKTDDRPWCNPATFLNQNRWEDQPATAPVRPHSTASPQRERTVGDVLREISSGTYKGPPGDSEPPIIDASFSRRN